MPYCTFVVPQSPNPLKWDGLLVDNQAHMTSTVRCCIAKLWGKRVDIMKKDASKKRMRKKEGKKIGEKSDGT